MLQRQFAIRRYGKERGVDADEGITGRKSRAQAVFERLRADIKAGRYPAGQRMREEDIAQRLGVSRTPVREALSRLQHHGLLENAADGLVVTQLTRAQILELYGMREMLEGAAARFAARQASPYDVSDLRRIAEAFEATGEEPDRLATLNAAFHQAIYEAAHNRYLIRTLGELHDALALLQTTTFTVQGRYAGSVAEHGRIVDAIEARDPDRAEREARDHIRHALEARLEIMRRPG
jgi:DNA-binding GntR family transcriptional regulator